VFLGLKNQFKGPHFLFYTEVIAAGDLVGRTTSEFFLSGLRKLEQRAKKCIELCGEYVE
jgi:hypothetical protein